MIIGKAAFEQALSHLIVRARANEEGVGLLARRIGCPADTDGDGGCGRAPCPDCAASRWASLTNVAEFPRLRYEVDNDELIAAYNELEADGLRPAVLVHSHLRGGTLPSPNDVRYATNPALLHMIVDLEAARPVPMLWRIRPTEPLDRQVERERFVVVDLGIQEVRPTDLTRGVTDA